MWSRMVERREDVSTEFYPGSFRGIGLKYKMSGLTISKIWKTHFSAGNDFSLFRGHMSFQIFLLVGHLTNWTGHNLLTDSTLKKRTQDVLVTCSVIVSDHNVKLAGHFQNLVGQCPMIDCYFQHCILSNMQPKITSIVTQLRVNRKAGRTRTRISATADKKQTFGKLHGKAGYLEI